MFKLFNCDSIRHFDIGLYMAIKQIVLIASERHTVFNSKV
jgi:hypothetical protein